MRLMQLRPAWMAMMAMTALALCAPRAHAYPTSTPLWGPSGLGTIPTTDTVPKNHLEAGLGYERVDPDGGGTVRFFPVLSGEFGFKNGEVGAGYLREDFRFDDFHIKTNDYNLNGKFRFLHSRREYSDGDGDAIPDYALAVGIHYTDFDDDLGHLTSYYLTGSKVIFQHDHHLLRAHLGVLYQRASSLIDETATRPMLGLDYRYNSRITLAGDYIPSDNGFTRTWSVVARYESKNNWGAQVGYGQFGSQFGSGHDNRFLASVAYRFGGRGTHRASNAAMPSVDENAKPVSGTFAVGR